MILQQPFAIPAVTNRVFYRTLTIDHLQVPSTQTDFPILVSFTNTTFKTVANGGRVKATNAFTFSSDSAGASLLKWEVERYTATSGEIVAWVKIASVSSVSDTVFYLRYGGSITTDQSDPTNVWTNSFRNVYHLKDGTTLSVLDTLATNNGTNHGATAAIGQIDGGCNVASASSQYIDCGLMGSNIPTATTLSAWIKGTTFPNTYNEVGGWDTNTGGTKQAIITVKSTGKLALFVQGSGSIGYDGTGSHTLSTGTIYYVVLTYSSAAGLVGYVDGASDGTAAANGNLANGNPLMYIGQDAQTAGLFFNGMIDEFRVATVARTANWVTVEYANQKTSQTLVALGSET